MLFVTHCPDLLKLTAPLLGMEIGSKDSLAAAEVVLE